MLPPLELSVAAVDAGAAEEDSEAEIVKIMIHFHVCHLPPLVDPPVLALLCAVLGADEEAAVAVWV